MNFITFFFRTYLPARTLTGFGRQPEACSSGSEALDRLACYSFGMVSFSIGFLGLIMIAAGPASEQRNLAPLLEAVSVFVPTILCLATMFFYDYWQRRVGYISGKGGAIALASASGLVVLLLALKIAGLAASWSPAVWLAMRFIPALAVSILLVASDGFVKWRKAQSFCI